MSKLIARLGTLACLGIVSVAAAANDDAARRFHTLGLVSRHVLPPPHRNDKMPCRKRQTWFGKPKSFR
ncbi:hypothetical protein ACVWWQ_003330 [Rhodanobacter sp. TND4EL1]